MKKVLITGGTGFIGSAIVNLLVNYKNIDVTVLDNNFRGNIKNLTHLKNKIKFKKCDIRNRRKLIKISREMDIIIHLAYVNGTKYFYSMPEHILDVGINGVMNVLEACKINNIKELFLASSSEVYQEPENIPTKEEQVVLKIPDIYNPRFSYGGGKILTELVGINYGKKFFDRLIIFRPHNVYGPSMGHEHVIPEFISKINLTNNNSNVVKIEGSGKEIRSFIFIDDFVQAFDKIFKRGKHLQIYNIGTENKIKIIDLAHKIANIMNKKIFIRHKSIKKGGTTRRCPDISKIKKLGFKQKFTLDNGLENTIKYYVNNYEKK